MFSESAHHACLRATWNANRQIAPRLLKMANGKFQYIQASAYVPRQQFTSSVCNINSTTKSRNIWGTLRNIRGSFRDNS
jgi:hypothetical protein